MKKIFFAILLVGLCLAMLIFVSCETKDSEENECDHPFESTKINEAKAPTCTEIGWDSYTSCSKCGLTTKVEKAALGHDEIAHEAKEVTCTEIGWNAYVTCSRCDYTTYEEISALGHDEIAHESKAPTCTEIGWNAYVTCSRCDYTTYEEIPQTHDYVDRVCTRCGSVLYSKGLDFTSNGDGTCYVSGIGTCTDTDIIISPISPDGDSVTCIGEGAFSECSSLTSITIPDGVTSIGSCAFEYCDSLTSITIPDSVTSIGSCAFSSCDSLTSITIPDGVTSIGSCAFEYCTSLESITVDKNNSVYQSKGNCLIETASKTLIAGCKNSVIPADGSVTIIGGYAFYGCYNLTSITIPDSVTSIGNGAFYYCSSLTSITIPDSVTSIGGYAFSGYSSLESITVDKNNSVYHSEGNCLIETASKTLIAGCKNSVIPADGSVTIIGGYAFYGCYYLTSITIPDSVASIGDYAFSDCYNLTSITISDSVTSIGDYAFYNCISLISITIPDSITSIGDSEFFNCDNLTSITIPDSVTSIGDSAFRSCSSLETVYYTGTEEEWAAITIYSYNDDLENANIIYNYVPEE